MRANRVLAIGVGFLGITCAAIELLGFWGGYADWRLLLRGLPPAAGLIYLATVWWDWPMDFRKAFRSRKDREDEQ